MRGKLSLLHPTLSQSPRSRIKLNGCQISCWEPFEVSFVIEPRISRTFNGGSVKEPNLYNFFVIFNLLQPQFCYLIIG